MGSTVPKWARRTFPKREEEEGSRAVIPRDDAVHVVIASQSITLRLSNAVAKAASRLGGAARSSSVSPVGGHLTAIRAWRQPPEISI